MDKAELMLIEPRTDTARISQVFKFSAFFINLNYIHVSLYHKTKSLKLIMVVIMIVSRERRYGVWKAAKVAKVAKAGPCLVPAQIDASSRVISSLLYEEGTFDDDTPRSTSWKFHNHNPVSRRGRKEQRVFEDTVSFCTSSIVIYLPPPSSLLHPPRASQFSPFTLINIMALLTPSVLPIPQTSQSH